jgi:hypothetical protein
MYVCNTYGLKNMACRRGWMMTDKHWWIDVGGRKGLDGCNETNRTYRNPTLREVWGRHSQSRKWELESSGTPENSKDNCRGQNTLHWSLLYTVGKVLECRCLKWTCMSHLDICSPSYGQKKGRESNWQFDSRPLKVRNRPKSDVDRWNATWRWKALEEGYKFDLNLIPIGGRGKKLWLSKVSGVQTGTVSGLHFGSLRTKSHSDVASMGERREYYMGEGDGFPRVRAVVNQVCQSARGLSQHPRVFPNVN